jgi:hypothetical protein
MHERIECKHANDAWLRQFNSNSLIINIGAVSHNWHDSG